MLAAYKNSQMTRLERFMNSSEFMWRDKVKEGKLNDFRKGGKVSSPKKSNKKHMQSREYLEGILRGK